MQNQYQNLDAAIVRRDQKKVKDILKAAYFDPACLYFKDKMNETPLQKAARGGMAEIVQLLIGAKINVSGSRENEALILAAGWGRTQVLSIIVDRRADINTSHPITQMTPLMMAAMNGLTSTCQFIINAKASVNKKCHLGKSALSIAWSQFDLQTVGLLVQHGAVVKPQLWLDALESINLCHTLATSLNIYLRQHKASKQNEINDETNKTRVPNEAVLQWIVHAPLAASVLMSEVLLQRSEEAPPRAELGSNDLVVMFSTQTKFDSDYEEFNKLCPPDRGKATSVAVYYLEVENPLRCELLYAISKSKSTRVYSSLGIRSIIRMAWESFVRRVYLRDVAIEFALLITMMFWVVYLKARDQVTFTSRWASLVLLGIITIREIAAYFQIMRYKAEIGDPLLNTNRAWLGSFKTRWWMRVWKHASLFDTINLASSTVLLFSGGSVTQEVEAELIVPKYLVSLSITSFIRWIRLLGFICAFRNIGPQVLPIIKSFDAIRSFLFVFFTTLLAFVHSTYIFNYKQTIQFSNFWEFFSRQYFLGMVTRWPVFMDQVCHEHHRDYHRRLLEQKHDPTIVDLMYANDPQNTLCKDVSIFYAWQMAWYGLMAFVVAIVLLQVFVGVLSAAYRDQRSQSYDSFLQNLAYVVSDYFICRSVHVKTKEELVKEKQAYKKLKFWKQVAYKIVVGLKTAISLIREATGLIKAPQMGQSLWMCKPIDQLNRGGRDQRDAGKAWNKFMEDQVGGMGNACRNESDSQKRFSDYIDAVESRIDHIFEECMHLSAGDFFDQIRFNRKIKEIQVNTRSEKMEQTGRRASLAEAARRRGRAVHRASFAGSGFPGASFAGFKRGSFGGAGGALRPGVMGGAAGGAGGGVEGASAAGRRGSMSMKLKDDVFRLSMGEVKSHNKQDDASSSKNDSSGSDSPESSNSSDSTPSRRSGGKKKPPRSRESSSSSSDDESSSS